MLKISYTGCLGLSLAILAQFTVEMHVAAQNCKKFTKTRYFGGSRYVDISKKRDANACYESSMSVPICNCFHVRRANSGKIMSF